MVAVETVAEALSLPALNVETTGRTVGPLTVSESDPRFRLPVQAIFGDGTQNGRGAFGGPGLVVHSVAPVRQWDDVGT